MASLKRWCAGIYPPLVAQVHKQARVRLGMSAFCPQTAEWIVQEMQLTPAGEAHFFFFTRGASLFGISFVRFFCLWVISSKPHAVFTFG